MYAAYFFTCTWYVTYSYNCFIHFKNRGKIWNKYEPLLNKSFTQDLCKCILHKAWSLKNPIGVQAKARLVLVCETGNYWGTSTMPMLKCGQIYACTGLKRYQTAVKLHGSNTRRNSTVCKYLETNTLWHETMMQGFVFILMLFKVQYYETHFLYILTLLY